MGVLSVDIEEMAIVLFILAPCTVYYGRNGLPTSYLTKISDYNSKILMAEF